VVANFRKQIRKNHIRQNVGKEKQKSTCFGIFTKITSGQVMNFIPVTVSTLYIKSRYTITLLHYMLKKKREKVLDLGA
jgi:hypothetical protein